MSSRLPAKPYTREFKYKQFEAEVILWAVRWYLVFPISYRDLVMMADERGLSVAHTTLMRWVHEYAPKLEKKIKSRLKKSNACCVRMCVTNAAR